MALRANNFLLLSISSISINAFYIAGFSSFCVVVKAFIKLSEYCCVLTWRRFDFTHSREVKLLALIVSLSPQKLHRFGRLLKSGDRVAREGDNEDLYDKH